MESLAKKQAKKYESFFIQRKRLSLMHFPFVYIGTKNIDIIQLMATIRKKTPLNCK